MSSSVQSSIANGTETLKTAPACYLQCFNILSTPTQDNYIAFCKSIADASNGDKTYQNMATCGVLNCPSSQAEILSNILTNMAESCIPLLSNRTILDEVAASVSPLAVNGPTAVEQVMVSQLPVRTADRSAFVSTANPTNAMISNPIQPPSSPTPPPGNSNNQPSTQPDVALQGSSSGATTHYGLIGGVVAGIAFVLIICTTAYFCLRRRKSPTIPTEHVQPAGPMFDFTPTPGFPPKQSEQAVIYAKDPQKSDEDHASYAAYQATKKSEKQLMAENGSLLNSQWSSSPSAYGNSQSLKQILAGSGNPRSATSSSADLKQILSGSVSSSGSSNLDTNPESWTSYQVGAWLRQLNHPEGIIRLFSQHNCDGTMIKVMAYSRDSCKDLLRTDLGISDVRTRLILADQICSLFESLPMGSSSLFTGTEASARPPAYQEF